MKKFSGLLFMLLSLVCVGCGKVYDDGDDELRTIPVTNNPQIVPNNPPIAIPGSMGGLR